MPPFAASERDLRPGAAPGPPAVDFAADAACRRVDPDVFFPPGYSREHFRLVLQAKAVCLHCPVTADCLALAMRTGEQTGIWGGHTPAERPRIRARGRLS